MKNNCFKTAFCLLILSIVFIGFGCSNKKAEKIKGTPVEITSVKEGEKLEYVSLSGTLTADREVEVSSKIGGKIAVIYVDEGQRVKEGQALCQLDNADLVANVDRADGAYKSAIAQYEQTLINKGMGPINPTQAEDAQKMANEGLYQAQYSMDLQEKEYIRAQQLFNEGAISKQQFDILETQYKLAKSQYETAKFNLKHTNETYRISNNNATQTIEIADENVKQANAALDFARTQLENAVISAPFTGTITRKFCKVGGIIPFGGTIPLFKLVDNSNVYFEGFISEMDIAKIKDGQKAEVYIYALDKKVIGSVNMVSVSSDPKSRSVYVKINLPNSDFNFNSGLSANAKIIIKKKKGILIPTYYIRYDNDKPFIVLADKGKAVFRYIKIGLQDENEALITEGLIAGDNVISVGHEGLKEGDIITDETIKPENN